MLIRTGNGSISFVAGCCWVNAVNRSTGTQATVNPEAKQLDAISTADPRDQSVQVRGGSSR